MAMQACDEKKRWFAELEDAHLGQMRPELQRTLLWLARGKPRQFIAEREGVQEATLKGWIGTATSEIAAQLVEPHANGGELRGAWVLDHLVCCLKEQLEACA